MRNNAQCGAARGGARRIHFAGVGGVGMAALAALAKARGADASGCDIHASPRTRWLESLGVRVSVGHSASHLDGVDELVVTPALSDDNPELARARELGIPVVRRGEALARIVSGCDSVAVCGTHGKTTTSTFTARLLAALGENVVWAIGGETGGFPVAGHSGGGDGRDAVLVVEADESDGTLALYHAATLVVTNCEYDHPDHFKSFDEYRACFDEARRNARAVIEAESQGLDDAALAGGDFSFLSGLAAHNAKNARAAAEVALRRGHPAKAVADALRPIVRDLPDRRFQIVWPSVSTPPRLDGNRPQSTAIDCNREGITIIADYAHHPTEMKCAVAMARKICAGELRVLFQPHRHSRTKALLGDFPAAFDGADETILCPTYAAFEKPVEGGDVADLYAECRRRRPASRFLLARSCREAWRHAFLEAKPGDATLLLGAGDIINLVPDVVRDMEAASTRRDGGAATAPQDLSRFSFFRTGGKSVGGGVRRVVGMGSNTWMSDLTTDEEFFRLDASAPIVAKDGGITCAPAGAPGAALGVPWMAGIPGTVGGWVRMNAGAFGHSIGELVVRVKFDGRWIDRDECGFAYRSSALDGVIEEVEFLLPDGRAALRRGPGDGGGETAAEFLAKRRKFPARCCGSVFKNPPGDFAGRLLEAAGAKSMSVGGASVWSGHANVIVAGDGATSSDVLALARLMRCRVLHRFGVALEPEICGLEVSP